MRRLGEYKGLVPRWAPWVQVQTACRMIADAIITAAIDELTRFRWYCCELVCDLMPGCR